MSGAARTGTTDHLNEAVAAYMRHDHAAALALFRPHAEAGDAEAQAWVGAVYANGSGNAGSLAEAFKWYIKAANQGHVAAQTNVGAMLAMGQGTPQDLERGIAWLEKAAEAGDPMACYNLATLHAKGGGPPQDLARATELYRFAAETGHYPSQARLGHHYAHGLGIEKNRVSAFAWLSLAAQHGVGAALNALEAVVSQMSAEEKQSGLALARKLRSSTNSGGSTLNPLPA